MWVRTVAHLISISPSLLHAVVRMDRDEAEEALRIRGSKPDDFIVRETDRTGAT